MDIFEWVTQYKLNGFSPFPLEPMSKQPVGGTPLFKAEALLFTNHHNIGLFAGSSNGLVIIDADNDKSKEMVTAKLYELKLLNWVTIVRTPKRGGLHFWLRVVDLPNDVQAYYKLSPQVGGGELRIRKPAYVVAPGSVIAEGKYEFTQGGVEYFRSQPGVSWGSLGWLIPDRSRSQRMKKATAIEIVEKMKLPYNPKPQVLKLLEHIKKPLPGGGIQRINYRTGEPYNGTFDTKSEAELALVTGLVMSGWNYDSIRNLFDTETPEHYINAPSKSRYFDLTFCKAASYVSSRVSV